MYSCEIPDRIKLMKIIRILFSIYYWIVFSLITLVMFIPATLAWLLSFWWDPLRRWNSRVSWVWARCYMLANPFWKLTIIGREKIDPTIPTLLVANHLSMWDIFVLFLLRKDFHWVSKRSNMLIPAIGQNMHYVRTILLDRDNPREILRMVKESVKRLEEGISLLIFPEGERSLTGRLQPFLGGSFMIAKRAHVRIQPVVIVNTFKLLPRLQWIFNPVVHLSATVLDPISKETVEQLSNEELSDLVYNAFLKALPADHRPAGDASSPVITS